MALGDGPIPAFAFVLTVGTATLVTLGAVSFHRLRGRSFGSALRVALAAVEAAYLVGIGVVWALAGGGSL